jgi:hypothetical protein
MTIVSFMKWQPHPARFLRQFADLPFEIFNTSMTDPPAHGRHPGDEPWGELAPGEHLVQFYAKEATFLDTLERFVIAGLTGRDSVVVIATRAHLDAVEDRLESSGANLDAARSSHRYISHEAGDLLSHFMVRDWPDERRLTQLVPGMLSHARTGAPRVRIFGEMVALLWSGGKDAAALRLEQFWHHFCHKHGFSVYCAYPQDVFTGDVAASMRDICEHHTRLVGAGFA